MQEENKGTKRRKEGVGMPTSARQEVKIRLSGKKLTEEIARAKICGFDRLGTAYYHYLSQERCVVLSHREGVIEEIAELLRRFHVSREDLARKGVIL